MVCLYSQEILVALKELTCVPKSIRHTCPSANHPSERSMKKGNVGIGLKNTSWFNLIMKLRKELSVTELGKGHLELLNQSGNVNSGLCSKALRIHK